MAGRLFDKLEQEAFRAGIAARTKASMEWFRSTVSNRKVSRAALIGDGPTRSRQVYGSMYNFQYDPKTKQTLPYYDRFPLSIILKPAKGGFLGLNLHYLPPILRAQFLDALMDNVTSKKSEDAKFELTVKLLASTSSLEFYKP